MSMYNGYTFPVEEMLPSIMPSFSSGKVTATRTFSVPCVHAEEFCLRMIGKFYDLDLVDDPYIPQLPAPYPFDYGGSLRHGQINLIASSFSIESLSECMFRNDHLISPDEVTEHTLITNPTSIEQQANHWIPEIFFPVDDDNDVYLCKVTIGYSENPCDCLQYSTVDNVWQPNEYILPGTCLSVERNPAYEMLTLPNGNLVWRDLPSTTIDEQRARQLKADSYAYKIIPKADIIVSWHNVPIRYLCAIENHLRNFRGSVNDQSWGDVLQCDAPVMDLSAACGCGQYEPETIMFIDYQEDRSQRTDAFGGFGVPLTPPLVTPPNMNTTTLKLVFKQKRIERPTPTASYSDTNPCPDDDDEAYGWNHLFFDRNTEDDSPGEWMRVAVDNAMEDPLFPLKNFVDIFYPVL